MFRKALTLVIGLLFLTAPVYAGKVATIGAQNSSGKYAVEVDNSHMITVYGGVYGKYEILSTNDSLTAVESGTHFLVDAPGQSGITVTLPDADVGLEYTWTAVTDDTITLTPQSTDYIVATNTAYNGDFAVGDDIINTGATGDSLHLICAKDLYWYVVDTKGTWRDND